MLTRPVRWQNCGPYPPPSGIVNELSQVVWCYRASHGNQQTQYTQTIHVQRPHRQQESPKSHTELIDHPLERQIKSFSNQLTCRSCILVYQRVLCSLCCEQNVLFILRRRASFRPPFVTGRDGAPTCFRTVAHPPRTQDRWVLTVGIMHPDLVASAELNGDGPG